MQSVIASQRAFEKQTGIRPEERMEFEAFVLNEMCQFTGAFCNSLHCDEMGYLCRVPYWLGTVQDSDVVPEKLQILQERSWEHMEKDIRNLRTALNILEMAENEEKFQCTIKRTMFPNGCSGKCYYR